MEQFRRRKSCLCFSAHDPAGREHRRKLARESLLAETRLVSYQGVKVAPRLNVPILPFPVRGDCPPEQGVLVLVVQPNEEAQAGQSPDKQNCVAAITFIHIFLGILAVIMLR